jgi:hypothetical protein
MQALDHVMKDNAQSTAEAELLPYNEAYQCGESTGALLEVLGYV